MQQRPIFVDRLLYCIYPLGLDLSLVWNSSTEKGRDRYRERRRDLHLWVHPPDCYKKKGSAWSQSWARDSRTGVIFCHSSQVIFQGAGLGVEWHWDKTAPYRIPPLLMGVLSDTLQSWPQQCLQLSKNEGKPSIDQRIDCHVRRTIINLLLCIFWSGIHKKKKWHETVQSSNFHWRKHIKAYIQQPFKVM